MPEIKQILQQKVHAQTGKNHSESVYASLYNTFSAFGLNEQNLIWIRYSGFLVLQGFIINAAIAARDQAIILLSLALFGIACSTTWHILNFAGWLNQNVWFSIAAGIKFTKATIPTPTTYWEMERSKKPTGIIYGIAQSVPLALLLVYVVIVAIALNEMIGTLELATTISATIAVLAFLIIGIVEKLEFDARSRHDDDMPFS